MSEKVVDVNRDLMYLLVVESLQTELVIAPQCDCFGIVPVDKESSSV